MTQNIDQLKQTRHNWLFLFTQGYALVALPLTLFNYASVAFYLDIVNIPALKIIFPNFPIFLTIGFAIGPVTCIIVGLIYVKSPYFRANFEVQTSANPYSFKLMPRDIPLYDAVAKICEKEGYTKEADELRKIINNSIS